MKIENDYPPVKKTINKFLIFKRIVLIIFLISIIVSVITNLLLGDKLWMFYVIGAEFVFYFAFLSKPLVENTFVRKVTLVVLAVCAYLYIIDLINKTNWSYFVISIISFCIIIFQLLLFFIEHKQQKKKFITMFLTAIGSIIFFILAITRVVEINWPLIVTGTLGVVTLIILLLFNRKIIIEDLKKYFSVK